MHAVYLPLEAEDQQTCGLPVAPYAMSQENSNMKRIIRWQNNKLKLMFELK